MIFWLLSTLLIVSSLGTILSKHPVHASLCFLLTLLTLAVLYLELHAEFVALMQVWVYAGAILVIFMFVIVLFQDAHHQIHARPALSSSFLLLVSASVFLATWGVTGLQLLDFPLQKEDVARDFGMAASLGQTLYIDFFFPFEAVAWVFLVATVGALYIARRES